MRYFIYPKGVNGIMIGDFLVTVLVDILRK